MTGPLAVTPSALECLGREAGLSRSFADASIVAVSGILTNDVNTPRFRAALDTVRASRQASVPHMIMLDNSSHPAAARLLAKAGATVVEVDHETQGGLARPFVIAAQLIDKFAPMALMFKFEAEKPVFGSGLESIKILEHAGTYDITTGERSASTWKSMPPYQVATELWLGACIGEILGVSHDTPSGLIILNQTGRRVFIASTNVNSWPYLFVTPYMGRREGLRVGSMSVTFDYHSEVVEEETGSAAFDERRRAQMDAMLAIALKTAGSEDLLDAVADRYVNFLRIYRDVLDRLANLT